MAAECEGGNLGVAFTSLANSLANATGLGNQGFAAAATRRVDGADALAEASRYSWTIAMQSPSMNAALGQRVAMESGSGRTRAETNAPVGTSAGGA